VLQEHLDSSKLDARPAGPGVLEHAWGRPKEPIELQEDLTEKPLDDLSLEELLALRDRLLRQNGLSYSGPATPRSGTPAHPGESHRCGAVR
jgi:hypothetical protein